MPRLAALLRPARTAFALVALLLAAPAPAEEVDPDIARFVAANTLWTLFHELGHGFVSIYDLPVVGREEDAVDQLATLVMLTLYGDDPDTRDLVSDAAYGWLLAAAQAEEMDDTAFWGAHALDVQRFTAMVCLLAGADEEAFAEVVELSEIPEDEVARCIDEYEVVARSWDRLLEPHRGAGGPGRLIPRYEASDSPAVAGFVAALRESGFDDLLAEIGQSYRLPYNIAVTFADCGEENAFWDPEAREITICHEMIEGLAALASE